MTNQVLDRRTIGIPGATGDVTPEMIALKAATETARDDAEAANTAAGTASTAAQAAQSAAEAAQTAAATEAARAEDEADRAKAEADRAEIAAGGVVTVNGKPGPHPVLTAEDVGAVPSPLPAASTAARGIVELATNAEAIARTDTQRALTPSNLLAVLPSGLILPYAGPSAPQGWLLCEGQAVSRTTYAGLFDVIGTTYGIGNGSTTFNLPDLRGRAPVGLSSTDAEFNTLGKTFGTKTHTLTVAEMPSHPHTADLPLANNAGSLEGHSGAWGKHAGALVSVRPAGGGGAHNNIQPSIALNYIIKI